MPGEAREKRFFTVVLATMVLGLWALPMASSFWLDETGTFWVIKDGVANVVKRSFEWSGQSPLYYLAAWLALALGGKHEWVMRAPSLIALLAGAWMFHRLALRLFDPVTARLALLFFVCSEPAAFAAADARPYALGLCMLIGSAWMLVRWLEAGGAWAGACYVLFAVLAVYTHYIFAPALGVLAIYALVRARNGGAVGVRGLLAAWTAGVVLGVPLLSQLLRFYQSRATHSFAQTPAFPELFTALAPPLLTGSIAAGLFLAWLAAPPRRVESGSRKSSVILAIAWALTPPTLFFLLAIFTPAKLFVPRYYISYVPGLCLAAGWIARSLASAAGRRMVVVVAALAAMLGFGSPRHDVQDWAGAMAKIHELAAGGDMPVLIASSFVEASDPKALDDPKLRDVLFAPQQMYPPGGRLIRLPYRLDAESEKYVERIIPAVENERRFVLVCRYEGMLFQPWIAGRLSPRGFRSEALGNFGSIGVFLFRRD